MTARVATLLFAVSLSGCELMPDPAFARLRNALTITIVDAKRSDTIGSIDFRLELANRGTTPAKACLGPSRSVSYQSSGKCSSSSGIGSSFVDHPGCMREFTIEPGGVMWWDETSDALHLPEGSFDTQVTVEIVNPRRCGSWGNCATLDVESNEFRIR